MNPTPPTVRHLRGCVVGAACAVTAIGAHTTAHGGVPDTVALTMLVAVCAGVGWLVAARSTARGSMRTLLVGLLGGQSAAHLALTAMSGGHGELVSMHMLALHAVAALTTAMVCRMLESAIVVVLTALRHIVRVLLSAPVRTRSPWTVRTSGGRDRRLSPAALASIGTRGPPAACRPLFTA
ncbi:hypothetical protein AAFP35_07940 [Gordonia sp. CPCC 206044]|uniref:hypothetical protein n=1 Tax=Gordonia sp. CPCC 206044 TaxID=3140793 RepID=UPI003AF372D0